MEPCRFHEGIEKEIAGSKELFEVQIADLKKNLNDKFDISFKLLAGCGALLIAILVTLILAIGDNTALGVRITHLENMVFGPPAYSATQPSITPYHKEGQYAK